MRAARYRHDAKTTGYLWKAPEARELVEVEVSDEVGVRWRLAEVIRTLPDGRFQVFPTPDRSCQPHAVVSGTRAQIP